MSNITEEEVMASMMKVGDRVRPGKDWDLAQCVELELRWQFCVHGSTCPEIHF